MGEWTARELSKDAEALALAMRLVSEGMGEWPADAVSSSSDRDQRVALTQVLARGLMSQGLGLSEAIEAASAARQQWGKTDVEMWRAPWEPAWKMPWRSEAPKAQVPLAGALDHWAELCSKIKPTGMGVMLRVNRRANDALALDIAKEGVALAGSLEGVQALAPLLAGLREKARGLEAEPVCETVFKNLAWECLQAGRPGVEAFSVLAPPQWKEASRALLEGPEPEAVDIRAMAVALSRWGSMKAPDWPCVKAFGGLGELNEELRLGAMAELEAHDPPSTDLQKSTRVMEGAKKRGQEEVLSRAWAVLELMEGPLGSQGPLQAAPWRLNVVEGIKNARDARDWLEAKAQEQELLEVVGIEPLAKKRPRGGL